MKVNLKKVTGTEAGLSTTKMAEKFFKVNLFPTKDRVMVFSIGKMAANIVGNGKII
jgi:hypothetical protein